MRGESIIMRTDMTHPDEAIRPAGRGSSAYVDNVIPDVAAWIRSGERCALVTLVGVEGAAPRAPGAQMAVSESGRWVGYISGGCLESAIALEAVEVIKSGRSRLLRYGEGSPYFDIRLPCGSGLDIFIQPFPSRSLAREMLRKIEERQPFALKIGLTEGSAALESLSLGEPAGMESRREGDVFYRVYQPGLRCLIVGSSPIAGSLAALSACSGFDTALYADAESMPALPPAVTARPLAVPYSFPTDPWTAAILTFHDHEKEIPAFMELMASPCFYLGAIGSRKAHEARKLALREASFSETAIARIKSPAGLAPGLKSAPHVALSILAEVVAVARERGRIS